MIFWYLYLCIFLAISISGNFDIRNFLFWQFPAIFYRPKNPFTQFGVVFSGHFFSLPILLSADHKQRTLNYCCFYNF